MANSDRISKRDSLRVKSAVTASIDGAGRRETAESEGTARCCTLRLMHTPLKLDTDVIQDRIFALQAALDAKSFQPEQVYGALIAISQELLFIAEDFSSRQMNDIVPGANVTF